MAQLDLSQFKLPASQAPTTKPSTPDLSSFTLAKQPAVPTEADVLGHISNVVSSIFPGKEIGNALGDNLYGIWQLIHGNVQGFQDAANDVGKIGPLALGGDAAATIATPASMLIGGPETAGLKAVTARVATNAAEGAALGGANAAANKQDIPTGALEGAGINAAGSGIGETVSALLSKLPLRLVRSALPKLKPGNETTVLQNTKLGSVSSMLDNSNNAVSNLGESVQQILASPKYTTHLGDGNAAIENTLGAFPNSEYDAPEIVHTVKSLVPEQSKLVSKIQQGTATLAEKNTVRQALDSVTKKRFTDHPQLTSQKEIGATFADSLRREVQSNAPETQPIFKTLSKEIDVRNALTAADKKLQSKSALSLYDIVAALGGLTTAGPLGAAGTVALEKAIRSPAANIGAAKALNAAGKSLPAINAVGKAAAPAIIKSVVTAPASGQ
jgi:hypothetical protein